MSETTPENLPETPMEKPAVVSLDEDGEINEIKPFPARNWKEKIFHFVEKLNVFSDFWKPSLRKKVAMMHPAILTTFTATCAFMAYFASSGIKTFVFTGLYKDQYTVVGKMPLKVAFTVFQLIGLGLSKVFGTWLIPKVTRNHRCFILAAEALLCEVPYLIFPFVGTDLKVLMVFISSLASGWVWGLIVMYLEGRRTSEILIMGLYLSVVVASGGAKSLASATMSWGISEDWMPGVCGGVATVTFIIFVNLIDLVPDPNAEDIRVRKERKPMKAEERNAFLKKWGPGLILITFIYAILTAYRNFRDYFAPEFWSELLGPQFDPTIFTQSELPVGIVTTVAFSLLYFIKDDEKAFLGILFVMILGAVLIGVSSLFFAHMTPLMWMITNGVGLFVAYIPPGSMLYDRLNGATNATFTSVFMIYLSDLVGYVATLSVLLYRSYGDKNVSYVNFFKYLSYGCSVICIVGIALAFIYFLIFLRRNKKSQQSPASTDQEMSNEAIMAHNQTE